MAFEAPGASEFSFEAGADLSLYQYHAVKMNSTGQVIPIAATTDDPVGILQNKPVSGEAATIWMAGISKIKTAAAINPGVVIGPSANGRAAGAYAKPFGRMLDTTTAADQLGSCVFDCRRPPETA